MLLCTLWQYEMSENLDEKITCPCSYHCESFRHRKGSSSEMWDGFHACTGWDSTPWHGILLEWFSAVLGLLKSQRKGDLPEMQNSSFVKYSVHRYSETLSTWPGQSWVTEPIIYARNSASDKWCALFSHRAGQHSGSNLATVSFAAPTTPSRDHGMETWGQCLCISS